MSPISPARALAFACFFESALLGVAYAAGWLAGFDPMATVATDAAAIILGLVAVMPMLILLWWGLQHPQGPIGRVTTLARDFVHQFLGGIGLPGFALISLLAGVCEEALFRGFLQTFVGMHSSEVVGLLVAAVLFGLAHSVSVAYGVLATVIGVYLGLLFLLSGNLIVPVICHTVYDFIALAWLGRTMSTSK
ncbi:MAG: CPBP family intramembrane metalloprotease [Gammaproteobacteria bacterium]|nr:CPBP family intramembrane metalloprotease [Gammaproteobacteria bacterium]